VGAKLVVIEELPDNIYSIRFILESLGYSVASVSAHADYLEEISALKPELIIVDMLMPAGRGLAVMSQLKNSSLKSIPSMAITADAVAIEEEKLAQVGFDEVLVKPYSVTELQQKLGKYLPEE
jgi:CheY-like chemotaxis protein